MLSVSLTPKVSQFQSAYYGATNSGDRQFIERLWPTLTKVAAFITGQQHGMNASGFGVPRTPHTTGRAGEWAPANWYDEVNFGGFDAIVGVYSVQALEAMARLARWISRPASEIAAFERLAGKARVAYRAVYWDDASGWFGEWRDLDGKLRSTGYSESSNGRPSAISPHLTPTAAANSLAELCGDAGAVQYLGAGAAGAHAGRDRRELREDTEGLQRVSGRPVVHAGQLEAARAARLPRQMRRMAWL